MHLVEILLPVYDNKRRPFPRADFDRVRAEGFWKDDDGETARDDVFIFEVMTEELDRAWWADYREDLRRRFRQEELVVRATAFERL